MDAALNLGFNMERSRRSMRRLVPCRFVTLKIIAESAKIVLALFAESANVSLLPLSDTNTKPNTKMKINRTAKSEASAADVIEWLETNCEA